MKSNSFREQVNIITGWFKDWNECEQTVALYSLLKKSSPVQAKFLDQFLQQSLADCIDVMHLEARANDEVYVRSLYTGERERVIHQLLQHLPLLQVGKNSVKKAYLQLIHELLYNTIHNGVNVEESRQLLSYSLIHPAINSEERSKLQWWLSCLDERFTYGNGGGGGGGGGSAISSCNGSGNNLNVGHSQSHSPSPGSSSQHSIAHLSPDLTLSQEYIISTNQGVAAHGPPSHGHLSPSPAISSSHGHSSPSPIIGSAPHSMWHQPHQGHCSGLDASAAINPLTTNGDTSGCAQYIPNGHMPLRSTNSHAGAFGASHGHMSIQATMSAPPNFTSIQNAGTNSHFHANNNTHAPLRRTPSITPPVKLQNPEKAVSEWIKTNHGHHPILASKSQYSDHAPLSPQSSVTSSGSGGSECHHDDGPQPSRDSFLEDGSGMREVPVWLKTLRLHKYAYLFRQMTYEDMLNVTEDWLEKHNVTKGARHKIYISIDKLRERQDVLKKLEKNIVEEGGSIKSALGEMKAMLNTPIKAFNPTVNSPAYRGSPSSMSSGIQSPTTDEVIDGDLPGQFCRLMHKVCSQLLVSPHPDDECFQLCLQLIDKCLNHEAFSSRQKKQLHVLKQSAQKMWQPQPKFLERARNKQFLPYSLAHTPLGVRSMRPGGSCRGLMPLTHSPYGKRSIVGSGQMQNIGGHMQIERNSSLNTACLNKIGLMEQTKTPISRTQSAPTHRPLVLPLQSADSANDTEINARLDSLCISMTEHALGSSDNSDRGSGF